MSSTWTLHNKKKSLLHLAAMLLAVSVCIVSMVSLWSGATLSGDDVIMVLYFPALIGLVYVWAHLFVRGCITLFRAVGRIDVKPLAVDGRAYENYCVVEFIRVGYRGRRLHRCLLALDSGCEITTRIIIKDISVSLDEMKDLNAQEIAFTDQDSHGLLAFVDHARQQGKYMNLGITETLWPPKKIELYGFAMAEWRLSEQGFWSMLQLLLLALIIRWMIASGVFAAFP